MMNKQDFEKLVYEKAEQKKTHDKNMKIIRLSIMPISAALVIVSLVGLKNIASLPTQNAATNGAADNVYSPSYNDRIADETEGAQDQYDFDGEYSYTDKSISAELPVDNGADTMYEDSQQSPEATQITFTANETITIYDPNDTEEIIEKLSSSELTEPSHDNTGYLGDITVNDLVYRLYADNIKVYENDLLIGEFIPDDNTINTLQKFFPIKFNIQR